MATPNKIVSERYALYQLMMTDSSDDDYYKLSASISLELRTHVLTEGFIGKLSAKNIIKLMAIQSTWRFIAPHVLYIQFSKAAEKL